MSKVVVFDHLIISDNLIEILVYLKRIISGSCPLELFV